MLQRALRAAVFCLITWGMHTSGSIFASVSEVREEAACPKLTLQQIDPPAPGALNLFDCIYADNGRVFYTREYALLPRNLKKAWALDRSDFSPTGLPHPYDMYLVTVLHEMDSWYVVSPENIGMLKDCKLIRMDNAPSSCVLPSEHWLPTYKSSDFRADLFYEKAYSRAISFLSEVFKPCDSKITVLEVGGGSGELAEMLLKEYGDSISCYYFLEKNQDACDAAKARLLKFGDKVIFWNEDIVELRQLAGASKFNLVIGMGVLTSQVLDQTVSQQALETMHSIVDIDGYVYLDGYAHFNFSKPGENPFGKLRKNWHIVRAEVVRVLLRKREL